MSITLQRTCRQGDDDDRAFEESGVQRSIVLFGGFFSAELAIVEDPVLEVLHSGCTT